MNRCPSGRKSCKKLNIKKTCNSITLKVDPYKVGQGLEHQRVKSLGVHPWVIAYIYLRYNVCLKF